MLDLAVAQAVAATALLADALHSTGRWTITVGGCTSRAHRIYREDGIVLRAHFPAQCSVSGTRATAMLQLDGEIRSVQEVEVYSSRGGFVVEFELSVSERIAA